MLNAWSDVILVYFFPRYLSANNVI